MRHTVKYLINPRELRPGWIGLYLATLALQVPCAAIRFFLAYPILWLALKLLGAPTGPAEPLSLVAGWAPLVLSAASVIAPLGGWWWEQREGGRSPSEREQLIYDDAIERLRQRDPTLREPRHWFVIDSETENAAAYASSLMVTRGLLDGGYLEAVLSHELGHLNSTDGRLTAALCRLIVPPRESERRFLNALFRVWSGSLAFSPLNGAWAIYWRGREHHADNYAARLGQADTLASYLDELVGHDYPVPWVWLTGHDHPPTEHRVDRLAHHAA